MFAKVGRLTLEGLESAGGMWLLWVRTLKGAFTFRFRLREVLSQMVLVGLESMPVVLLTGAFTGMVLAVQSYYQSSKLGAESIIGALVALSMFRELGPVLTGLMLAGRVGAAMAAELGTMRVTEQIDALRAFGVNPVNYLVVPRFIATTSLLPVLTIFTDFVGVVGGYIVAVERMGVNRTFYLDHMISIAQPKDILVGLAKAVVFGIIIAVVSCYKGMTAKGGAQGVGRATTSSVVTACIMILVSDFFITFVFKILGV